MKMMILKQPDKDWIEGILQRMPFVMWDRFTDNLSVPPERWIRVFGWIERPEDSYKDFVLLDFDIPRNEAVFISTSSAAYSKQIGDILETGHTDCQRVEDAFSIPNRTTTKRSPRR